MNRRDFFQLAAASAAASAVHDSPGAGNRSIKDLSPTEVAADEDYWTEVRNAFTIDRNVINFNNGYVSPAPIIVQEAMRRYLEFSDMGPWHTMINNLERQVEAVRRRLAQAAGCDPWEMALTRHASEALENAQDGVDLEAGDWLRTTNQDYPRMLTPARQRQSRGGT